MQTPRFVIHETEKRSIPNPVATDVAVEELADELRRVDITIENTGYLPSYVLSSAKKLSWNEELYLELECEGCSLAEGPARRRVGHLDGWGRGLGDGTGAARLTDDVIQVLTQLGPVMKQLSGVDLDNLLQNISRLPGAVADNLDAKGSKGS